MADTYGNYTVTQHVENNFNTIGYYVNGVGFDAPGLYFKTEEEAMKIISWLNKAYNAGSGTNVIKALKEFEKEK